MKLFFWRRKPRAEADSPVATTTPAEASAAGAAVRIERSQIPTRPLAMPIELRDALLRFALDCLVVGGAKVRVEADDLISAVLPDGTAVRYTTTLTRARAEEETELLVQGGGALARLLEECATHAAVASLRLEAHTSALESARGQLAAPAAGCGACAHDTAVERCQRCPLRTGSIVLLGVAEGATPRVARQWMSRGVELAYSMVSNDRNGRRDEDVRLAFDSQTGRRLPRLTPEMLADAQAGPPPPSAAGELDGASARAARALTPQLHAAGALLRLVAEREYRARLDDIQTTSQRLLRESPDDAPAIRDALARELARLSEAYAVEVDARLTSVCFVERPMAALALPVSADAGVELTVDLSAGTLLPPLCAGCGAETRAASVCSRGHLICPACQHREDAAPQSGCPVCAGIGVAESPSSADPRDASEILETTGSDNTVLTLTHLETMSPAMWRRFVMWLLEQDDYRIERGGASGALEYWECRSTADDAALLAGAIRYADGRMLAREDVERLRAQHAGESSASSILISTAAAGDAAVDAARRLGVHLLDGAALADRLEGLVAHQLNERAEALRTVEMSAEAATITRAALLGELRRAEETLASAASTRRASGRSAVVAATKALVDVLVLTRRALLAWETLVADWTAAFDEREARDGTLSISANAGTFEEMAERARHLGDALVASLERAVATPGEGDLGYTVWRRDTLEQLSAQCEAYRWRVQAVDPSRWRDFAAAHDMGAYERADAAATTAAHAAARMARAYAELARRARIEASIA